MSKALDLKIARLNVERVVLQVHRTRGSNQLTGTVENVTCYQNKTILITVLESSPKIN